MRLFTLVLASLIAFSEARYNKKTAVEFIGLPQEGESWYGAQRVTFMFRVLEKVNEGRFWNLQALRFHLDNPFHRSRPFYNVVIMPPKQGFQDGDGVFVVKANVPTVRVKSPRYYIEIESKWDNGILHSNIAKSPAFLVQPAWRAPLEVSDPFPNITIVRIPNDPSEYDQDNDLMKNSTLTDFPMHSSNHTDSDTD
jgi:hypothetical protein